MVKNEVSLSIVVPAFNRSDLLSVCLQRISQSNVQPKEVIIVDDASTEDLKSIVEKFGYTYHRLTVNSGQSVARNTGADLATGDLLLFLDSDVGIQPTTLEQFVNAFRDPRVNVAQGIFSPTPLSEGLASKLFSARGYFLEKDHGYASFIHSYAFTIRRDVFFESAGFSRAFQPPGGGEEFEYGSRLNKKYVIHTLPEVQVEHTWPGFFKRGVLFFHRAFVWSEMFAKSKKFTKIGASRRDSFIGILALSGIGLPISLLLTAPYAKYGLRHLGFFTTFPFVFTIVYVDAMAVAGGLWGLLHYYTKKLFRPFWMLRFLLSKLPAHLIFFVTARCNAKCGHCFYWKEIQSADKSKELSLEEIESITKNFGHIKHVSLTGGEPTLRSDLSDIVRLFRKNCGTDHVSIHTNGYHSEKIVRIAKEISRDNPAVEVSFTVSIDGFADTHDKVRGIEGLFTKCEETLTGLIQAKSLFPNLNVTVNTTFNRDNQDEARGLMDYFLGKFAIDGYYFSLIRGNVKDSSLLKVDLKKYADLVKYRESRALVEKYYDNFFLSSVKRALEFLIPEVVIETATRGKTTFPCTAGKNLVVIDEYGVVSPCEMLGKKLGDLRQNSYDIKKILASQQGRSIRSFIAGRNCACTWECGQVNSLVFNWQAYPRLIRKWLQLKRLIS